jgi:hypothetical protein
MNDQITTAPWPSGAVKVHHADLFEVLDEIEPYEFESAYFDIWQPTGQMIWERQVVPLRRKCRNKIDLVLCWNESEMLGQYLLNGAKYVDIDESKAYDTAFKVLRRAAVNQMLRGKPRITNTKGDLGEMLAIEAENRNDVQVQMLMRQLFYGVGTDEWEELFGEDWDDITKETTNAE